MDYEKIVGEVLEGNIFVASYLDFGDGQSFPPPAIEFQAKI